MIAQPHVYAHHLPGHVPRRGQDASVIQKSARGKVSRVTLELLADSHIALTSLETIDGADVVKATTGNKAA
jgi:hypothetical protein